MRPSSPTDSLIEPIFGRHGGDAGDKLMYSGEHELDAKRDQWIGNRKQTDDRLNVLLH